MDSTSETPFWINFFTTAGIPAGDSAHYAIMFSDNRITKEMLLDLSKEYLTDMGISRLGDIIAILKHAKQVHQEEAKDKLLKLSPISNLTTMSSLPASAARRSTAASRMVNHFTSKHPEAAPMSQQPVPRPTPPDPPQSKRKVSVFERLGAEDDNASATVNVPKSSPSQPGNSVFSRLGGKSETTGAKRSLSMTSFDEPADLAKDTLPYVGVLKNTGSPSPIKRAKPTPLALKAKNFRIKKIVKTTAPSDKSANIQRPEISTTTEGVLSDHAKREAPSLRDRLGAKQDSPSTTITSSSSTLKNKKGSAAAKVSLQTRLGVKREEPSSTVLSSTTPVVSSTQQSGAKSKGFKPKYLQSEKSEPLGVFSRLGKKSKV